MEYLQEMPGTQQEINLPDYFGRKQEKLSHWQSVLSDFLLQQLNCYQKEVIIDHLYPFLFPATPIIPAQKPAIGKQPANIPGGGAGSGQYFKQGDLWLGGWQ